MLGNPTAKQKRFHQWCRDKGCIVSMILNPSLHHIKGSKMKLKGVDSAGEWYVLPVDYYWHQDGKNPNAIHTNRKAFEKFWEMSEKDFWIELINDYEQDYGYKPMSDEEYQIIVDRA